MKYRLLLVQFAKKEKLLTTILFFFISAIIARLFLLGIPEQIPRGAEIGNIINNLGLGYITSYFFYFLVSYVKNEKDKNNVNEFLSFNATLIIIDGYTLLNFLKQESKMQNAKTEMPPTKELVEKMVSKINLDSAPLSRPDPVDLAKHLAGLLPSVTGKNVDWMEYFRHMKKEAEKPLEKLLELLPYMDSELTSLVYKIRESSLFYTATHLVTGKPPHNEKDSLRGMLPSPIYEYLTLIKTLEDYVNTNFSTYSDHNKLREERK